MFLVFLGIVAAYFKLLVCFAKQFGRSRDLLGPDEIRDHQLHLLQRKVSWSTFNQAVCALRFLYGTALGRPELVRAIPYGLRLRKSCVPHIGHSMSTRSRLP